MWHSFGGVGHWSEWHAWAPNMRAALEMAAPKIAAYGHAFVEDPTGAHAWFASRRGSRVTVRPYKPLQSDWGIEDA